MMLKTSISEESIENGQASVFINKEIQRVQKESFTALNKKDVISVFPESKLRNKTILILKSPKTITSTRKVFLPKTVAEMLVQWKKEQDDYKSALGEEYPLLAFPSKYFTKKSRVLSRSQTYMATCSILMVSRFPVISLHFPIGDFQHTDIEECKDQQVNGHDSDSHVLLEVSEHHRHKGAADIRGSHLHHKSLSCGDISVVGTRLVLLL